MTTILFMRDSVSDHFRAGTTSYTSLTACIREIRLHYLAIHAMKQYTQSTAKRNYLATGFIRRNSKKKCMIALADYTVISDSCMTQQPVMYELGLSHGYVKSLYSDIYPYQISFPKEDLQATIPPVKTRQQCMRQICEAADKMEVSYSLDEELRKLGENPLKHGYQKVLNSHFHRKQLFFFHSVQLTEEELLMLQEMYMSLKAETSLFFANGINQAQEQLIV